MLINFIKGIISFESICITIGISYVLYKSHYSITDIKNPKIPKDAVDKEEIIKIFGNNTKIEIEDFEQKAKMYAKKMGIKNLKIYYLKTPNAEAYPGKDKNILAISPSYVLSNEILFNLVKENVSLRKFMNFVICHELSHLSSRIDYYTSVLRPWISIFGMLTTLRSPRIGFYTVLCINLFTILQCRYSEKQADINAAKVLGGSEEGIEYFQAIQKSNRIMLSQYNGWDKYMYGSNGDYYLDILHPLLSQRIKYINFL